MLIEKYVLALRCLNAALALDPNHPELHVQAVTFRNLLNSNPELPLKVVQVLKEEFKAIEASADLKKYNEDYQKKHRSSPLQALAAIKAKRLLGDDKTACEKELLDLASSDGVQFTHALEIFETLKKWRSSEMEAFKKLAQSKWPNVTRLA